jgi:hypothetical protein
MNKHTWSKYVFAFPGTPKHDDVHQSLRRGGSQVPWLLKQQDVELTFNKIVVQDVRGFFLRNVVAIP